MKKIGFIGTGIMGSAMVRNLLKAGFEVSVYNRTREKALALTGDGAVFCETVKECAADKDAVITIVGYPKDVEEVYFSEEGILASAKEGAYVIDMTTSSPVLAEKIAAAAKEKGMHAVDAPVTGGDSGAKAGTLTILCGGEKEDFDALAPVFAAMGKNIQYMGKAGNGQHTKMCNQIAIAGALSGACEAIAYAKAAGLDPALMVDTIATGAASSFQLSNVAKKGMNGDFAPGFILKHFIKDMNLADQAALENGLKIEITEHVRDLCQTLADNGHANEGTQTLLHNYFE